MNLTTATTERPSSWLLNNEPDLTPEQVWMILGTPDRGRSIRNGVAIADNAEQASQVVEEQYQWEPLVVVSETGLAEWIEAAEEAPAYVVRNVFGHAGTRRFACMFGTHDAQHPIRQSWVMAANERAAHDAWRQLGETEEPAAVCDLSNLTSLREKVRSVRLHRGNGAMTDGRQFSDRDERWYELEAQKRPGGRAELNANAQRLHAIQMRVHANQLAANGGR